MSLFDSFSAPKWQHKKTEVRLEGVAELQDQAVLLTLAQSDPEDSVRSAALTRIEDPHTLDKLIETLPPNLQQQARQQRLQQLLPDHEQLAKIADDALLLRIAELSDDESLGSAAIASIHNSALLQEIAGAHPLARIRLNACAGINDLETLRELMHLARGRDKGIYRHCKARLDEHDAQQEVKAQREQKVQQLLIDAEELKETVVLSEFKGRYLAIVQKWQGVAEFAATTEADQFGELMANGEQRLAEAAQEQAAQEEAQLAAETTHQLQQGLLTELQSWAVGAVIPEGPEPVEQMKTDLLRFSEDWKANTADLPARREIAEAYTELLSRWQTACHSAQKLSAQKPGIEAMLQQAQKADHKDFQGLQKSITQLEKLLARLTWPADLSTELPAPIRQLRQALDDLRSGLDALKSKQVELGKKVTMLLQNLQSELEQNQTKKAGKALNKVRNVLASLEPARRLEFEQKIRPLSARLHEVHDWQDFAIEPKKHELCASMEALIGSEEDTEILAVKIQALQEQWKQVGALPHAQEQELWLRFKAASDEAWKPCKEAIARQTRLHRENFKQRMQVVAQLDAYDQAIAWPETPASEEAAGNNPHRPAPDWSLVQKTLDVAREEFQRIQPVDPKGARQSQKAFREICDRIYGHISKEYERNIALKEQLVERAQKLAAQEDLSKAIDQAKRLQQEWKAVGITPVKADRSLWQAFRKACDAVFQRLDEQRAQDKANTSDQIQQAETLRQQAHELMQAAGADSDTQAISSLAELKRQLYSLQLPSAVQQRVLKDLQDLEKQARERIHQQRASREKAAWTNLSELMQAASEGRRSADNSGDDVDPNSSAADNLPKGIDSKALLKFIEQGPGTTPEEALREACIALEVLTETESPIADKQARMKYQMQRLVEGIGRAELDVEKSLLANINEFIALHPAENWVQRYCAVLSRIKAR